MLRAVAVGATLGLVAGHGAVLQSWTKPPAPAGVTGSDVDYVVEGKTYEGYQALPPAGMQVQGFLLVAHGWMGLGAYYKARAEQFASMGYVAFCGDYYGKGERCSSFQCASEKSQAIKANMTKLKMLISASTDQVLAHPGADREKLVAMGYCFGGGIVLELARHPEVGASAGVTYRAVSAIHTSIEPYGDAAERGAINTSVQVHHAELDFATDAGLRSLEDELRNGTDGSGAAWESVYYSHMVHSWTDASSVAYDARAAVQVHESTEAFFRKALGNVDPAADAFPPLCPKHESGTPEPDTTEPGTSPWLWVAVVSLLVNAILVGYIVFVRSGVNSNSGDTDNIELT